MPFETRAKKREAVEAEAEYAINEATEKTIKLNIPESSIQSAGTAATFIKGRLLDVSVLGCAIDSPYIIPAGVILDIRIDPTPFMTETGTERKAQISVVGIVKSCVMKTTGHYRLGICFTKIGKEHLDIIEAFIKSKERRKAPRWDMQQ